MKATFLAWLWKKFWTWFGHELRQEIAKRVSARISSAGIVRTVIIELENDGDLAEAVRRCVASDPVTEEKVGLDE